MKIIAACIRLCKCYLISCRLEIDFDLRIRCGESLIEFKLLSIKLILNRIRLNIVKGTD